MYLFTLSNIHTPQEYMLTQNIDIVDDLNAVIRANIDKKIIVFFQTVKISTLYADTFEKNEIVVELDDMEGSVRETADKERVKHITAKIMKFNGKMDQETRSAVFADFLNRKSGVLFTTNIAARGLGILYNFVSLDQLVDNYYRYSQC